MRYPATAGLKQWPRYYMIFLFGILAGIIISIYFKGYQIETLIQEKAELKAQIENLDVQLKRFKESEEKKGKQKGVTVADIEIIIENDISDLIKPEIIRRMNKELVHLEGQDVEQVAGVHRLIFVLFKDKKYLIDNKPYVVHLNSLVISQTVYLYVTVSVEKI